MGIYSRIQTHGLLLFYSLASHGLSGVSSSARCSALPITTFLRLVDIYSGFLWLTWWAFQSSKVSTSASKTSALVPGGLASSLIASTVFTGQSPTLLRMHYTRTKSMLLPVLVKWDTWFGHFQFFLGQQWKLSDNAWAHYSLKRCVCVLNLVIASDIAFLCWAYIS